MTRNFPLAAAGCAVVLLTGPALAQNPTPPAVPAQAPAAPPAAPAPAPPAAQPATPAAPGLALDQARRVAAAAEAEAKRLNLSATIVVVGANGDIVLAQKMDNAPYGGFEPARRKARAVAVASLRKPGVNQATAATPPLMVPASVTPTGGGEVIVSGGKVVGAVGVSAGKLQEEQVAKVGAAALR
jgi:glc operon protein GlcG